MKYCAIIFDMDGTIIDTNEIWNTATKNLLKNRNIVLDPEQERELLSKVSGMGLPQSCKLIKEYAELPDEVPALIQEKSNNACSLFESHIKFMDGFERFHQVARGKKLLLGVATNADDATLHLAKKKLNLEDFFGEHIYNISVVNNKAKPDPAVYLHTAQQLGISPNQCIAIEDSAHGIAAAKAAQLFCIGLNMAQQHHQVQHADLIVDHFNYINLDSLLYEDEQKKLEKVSLA